MIGSLGAVILPDLPPASPVEVHSAQRVPLALSVQVVGRTTSRSMTAYGDKPNRPQASAFYFDDGVTHNSGEGQFQCT
jgi:hypothetical protein